MPKIIENVREQLLAEAKKQILERGYADTTIRSVSSACGLGIGTVYNYFKSKELLIATVVYEDWKKYLYEMHRLPCHEPRVLLKGIYDALIRFAAENEKLFSDSDAAKHASVGSSKRHKMLRGQIAGFIVPICESTFCAEFVAESLICWSMENADFETVYPLLEKLIHK
ncbi:MAG: TetR/AcrR family transcriptional regulator [Ruminococcaceae bacterium]|nr:TetR/AcrR family transcriptional regulator [Oscillospiraceae bacterium]